MKNILALLTGVLMVVGLALPVYAETVAVGFDFTGQGGIAVSSDNEYIASWDYAVSSALAVFGVNSPLPIAEGDIFTLYTHGVVDGLTDSASVAITLRPGLEITVVSGFKETVSYLAPSGLNANFSLTSGAPNFFEMYIDTSLDSDSELDDGSAGTGFSNGTLLLSGGISYSFGSFGVDPNGGTPRLDLFGSNDANAASGFNDNQLTVVGNGSSSVTISVTPIVINRDYFFDVPDAYGLDLFFNTSQVLPFRQVDPSNHFYDGTNDQPLSFYGTMGAVNGFTRDGTLFEFQVDANASQSIVPEPGTMLLLGSGLLGVAIIGRKRMTKK